GRSRRSGQESAPAGPKAWHEITLPIVGQAILPARRLSSRRKPAEKPAAARIGCPTPSSYCHLRAGLGDHGQILPSALFDNVEAPFLNRLGIDQLATDGYGARARFQ